MSIARALRTADRATLRRHITDGHSVDASAIEGWVYRGTSLGLPRIVELATWKTFQKTFWRHPSGRLIGWNVRLEQDGLDAPSRPERRRGEPVTVWPYEVIEPGGVPMPDGFGRGLLIDYSRMPNAWPQRLVRDPLVALEPGHADELLGVSYVVIGGRCVETPTYFTLERDHRVEHVPDAWLRAAEQR